MLNPATFAHVAEFASPGTLQALSVTNRDALNQAFGPSVGTWHSIHMRDWPFAPTEIIQTDNWLRRRDATIQLLARLNTVLMDASRDPEMFDGDYENVPFLSRPLPRESIISCLNSCINAIESWRGRLRSGKLSELEERDLLSSSTQVSDAYGAQNLADGDVIYRVWRRLHPLTYKPHPGVCDTKLRLFTAREEFDSKVTDRDLVDALARVHPGVLKAFGVRSSKITDAGLLSALERHSPRDLQLDSCGSGNVSGASLLGLPSLRRLQLNDITGGVAAVASSAPHLQELYLSLDTKSFSSEADISAISRLKHLHTLVVHARRVSSRLFLPVFRECTLLRTVQITDAVSCDAELLRCIMEHLPDLHIFKASYWFDEFDDDNDRNIQAFRGRYPSAELISIHWAPRMSW